MRFYPAIFLLLLPWKHPKAQDSIPSRSALSVNGYVKDMQSLQFTGNFSDLTAGNLIHNRFNFRLKRGKHFSFAAEVRNRFFWGDDIRVTPDLAKNLRNNNEWMNLSHLWLRKNSYALHSQIDRLWGEYSDQHWTIRAGRQRLNWGITTQWNPNDLFNTFNFLDFDYEERPGTDALSVKYTHTGSATTTLAYTPGENAKQSIAALKHAWNRSGYDLQLVTGWYRNQLTIGGGWAGSIKEAGFKGEIQYYIQNNEERSLLNISLEADYAFKKGWYLNSGILFNDRGSTGKFNALEGIDFRFTPKYLMPTRWNFLLTTGKSFTPLFSGYVTTLYAPGSNLLLLLPSLRYNVSDEIDFDCIWQSFWASSEEDFSSLGHRLFLRLKWNF
jgi:hypothetical protein